MITDKVLIKEDVSIRNIELSDCNENYLRWLNDTETNRYLEARWKKHTLKDIEDYVRNVRESDHSYLFAILYKDKHVGNIKIGPINPLHKFADIGYFIGDKTLWGKGIATKAINLVIKFGFEHLNLHKIQASFYDNNTGSKKALLNNGFSPEGIFRKKYKITEGAWSDIYEYGILESEYKKER